GTKLPDGRSSILTGRRYQRHQYFRQRTEDGILSRRIARAGQPLRLRFQNQEAGEVDREFESRDQCGGPGGWTRGALQVFRWSGDSGDSLSAAWRERAAESCGDCEG